MGKILTELLHLQSLTFFTLVNESLDLYKTTGLVHVDQV